MKRERERETEGGRRRRQGDARRGVGEAAAAAGEVHRVLPGRAAAAPGQPRAEVPAGRVPRGRQPVARRPRGLGDPGGETPPRPGSLPGVGGGGGGGCARGVRYVCVCVPGRLTGSQLVDFTPGVCVCVCVSGRLTGSPPVDVTPKLGSSRVTHRPVCALNPTAPKQPETDR